VVAAGDSLLNIANQYDVNVAALQEANGILDPRALQVGQQLIIPLPVADAAADRAALTPTATPLPVTVQNVYFSETTVGGLWVMGEVRNESGVPLEQVRVGVTLLDTAGGELAQADALAAFDLVEVGESAPFAILIDEAPPHFARYRIYPLRAVAAYVGSYYRDLDVRNLQYEGERYASYTVSGTVYNPGPVEAIDIQVVLTAYDARDRVVAMRQVEPTDDVAPRGGETTFSTVLVPMGGPVARVEAVAQGRRAQADP